MVGRHDPRVMRRASASPLLHQAVACEQIAGGADRRPGDGRMARLEPLQQLLRPPIGVLATGPQKELRDRVRDLVRTVMGRSTAIAERWPTPAVVAGQPFVAGLPADGVASAELHHCVEPESVIINEAFAFFHGYRLQPGHRPTSVGPQRNGVTHVAGLMCYLCTRFVPLTG